MAPRQAFLYDAHEYVAGESQCSCDDAHAPCLECGASEHAYVHTDEARESHYVLVTSHVTASDSAAGGDVAGV